MYLSASKTFLLIATALTIFKITSSPVQAQTTYNCPDRSEPLYFSVKATPKNITYNLKLNKSQIIKMAARSLPRGSSKAANTLGLTSVGHSLKYAYQFRTHQIGPKRYCARLLSVEIDIEVTRLEVFSLRKYPRGSCQYNAIVDHEHEHVAAFQRAIETLEEVFTHEAPDIIDRSPPGVGISALQAQHSVTKSLKYNINKIRDRIIRQMTIRNRQIDTPLNYKRISQKCDKW